MKTREFSERGSVLLVTLLAIRLLVVGECSILSVIQVESSVCLILLERRGLLLDTIELLLSSALWVKVVLCGWVM